MRLLVCTQKVDREDSVLGFFHGWIKEFSRTCESVVVICLEEGEHDLPDNITVLSLGKENSHGRIKYLANFFRYVWLYRNQYDHVFVHMNHIYVILGGLLWRMLRKRVGLWYAHGHVPWLLYVATWLSNIVFTSTHSGFRIMSNKKVVVGQGIDTNHFKQSTTTRNRYRIVYVSRIAAVKDHLTILRAIKRLNNSVLSVYFVGDTLGSKDVEYMKILKKYIDDNDLSNHIKFLGAIPNLRISKFLTEAGMFVNASKTGSLDKAGLEAMATGLPVITCNEAYSDMLSPAGLMYTEGDDEILADKISAMLELSDTDFIKLSNSVRGMIVKEHNIEGLISRIINHFSFG